MQAVLAQIERTVPGALRATGPGGRETDIAVDHSEFTHLPRYVTQGESGAGFAKLTQCIFRPRSPQTA